MLTKIYTDNPNWNTIDQVVAQLLEGHIIIYPTGLGYAYGCSALKQRAIEKVCTLKGVDWRKHRLAVMCPSINSISEYAKVDNHSFQYIKANEKEPITYILPAKTELPKMLQNNHEIGIRLSLHPITTLLLQTLGSPLLTASLPIRHEEPEYLTDPELIDECYGKEVYTIIDGGVTSGGYTSIIRLSHGEEEVVREGQKGFSILL